MNTPILKSKPILFKQQTKQDWENINKNKNLKYKYDQHIFDPIYFQKKLMEIIHLNNNQTGIYV